MRRPVFLALGRARGQAKPVQRIFQRLSQRPHLDARLQEFGNIQDVMGLRFFRAEPRRVCFRRPDGDSPRLAQAAFQAFNDLASRDSAWIGHVINAERRAHFPQVQRGLDEIFEVRKGIDMIIDRRLVLQRGKGGCTVRRAR